MNEQVKTVLTYLFIGVACLCIGFTTYTLFSGNGDGTRVDAIRADLSRIEAQQRDTIKRLDTITKGLDKSIVIAEGIADRVSEVTDTVTSVENRVNSGKVRIESSQRRIDEGISVLQGIREREQTKVK